MNGLELPKSKVSTPCITSYYLDQMKKQTSEILTRSERFINPATAQEMFFTDQAIYVYNEHGYLIPFVNIHQIKRSQKPISIEVEETPLSDKFSPLFPSFGEAKYQELDSMFSPLGGNAYKTPGQFGFELRSTNTSPILRLLQGSGSTGMAALSPYGSTPL
eukprot:TRINITY_DN1183_c0_g2_i15.p1 TRINITY_DN1183_c0_g2~~TRINITY_DN1183_c0_g2_i15.p1  ORF type:complete len:161 (+),score=38.63 TRINITY_DN1183_c0_g2_i15:1152-1634(+)